MTRKPWLLAVILMALAALGIALILLSLAPPPPVSPLPLSSPPAPSAPSRPAPDPTFTPPISPTPTRKPTPTFYVTLYPYSLDSLEGWSFYTNTDLKIAFPYPAEPPDVYYSESKQSWGIVIQARWDPTNRWGYAWIAIFIWENPDNLPLDSAVIEIARKTGNPEPWPKIDAPNPTLVESLKRAGAEEVAVYMHPPVPVYVASYQRRIYIFGGGV